VTPAGARRAREPARHRRREVEVEVAGRLEDGRRGARAGAPGARRRGEAGGGPSRAARRDQVAVEAALLHLFGVLLGW